MNEMKLLCERWLQQPLGSMSKRELELMLLNAFIEGKYLSENAAALARSSRITLCKSHGYLTDLALRNDTISDEDAVCRLVKLLNDAEVISEGTALLFTVQDASLRLWVENSLAQLNLLQGETLRPGRADRGTPSQISQQHRRAGPSGHQTGDQADA